MKTTSTHPRPAPDADDRLMDTVIREHARAGTGADETLLAEVDREITGSAGPTASHSRLRFIAPAGIAAAAAVALAIVWTQRTPDTSAPPAIADTTAGTTNGEKIPLTTDLPPEMIEGTPVEINVPGLVGVPTEPPTMMVPEGTELLSRGKPVTSSDDFPLIGSLDVITNGEKNAGEGYYVELDSGPQWVQIDLEQTAEIHAVWVWHFHSQRRAYHDVIIRISDDPGFEENVTTIFNNDFDNSTGLGRGTDLPYIESRYGLLVDARGTRGRYVRLHSNGNTSDDTNHYTEVEVFGIPAE